MREIKFRAWDKQEKQWYVPIHEAYNGKLWELFVSFGGELSAHTMEGMSHQSLFPDRYELMQYTGLKDKNGTEIYEGDIVGSEAMGYRKKDGTRDKRVPESQRWWQIQTVEFGLSQDYAGGYECENGSFYGWNIDPSNLYELEVIGNIYENPELLNGGNN